MRITLRVEPALFLLILLVATACTRLPEAELRAYAASYQQAAAAGNRLLDEVAPVVATGPAEASSCPVNERGYRPCFDPALALAGMNGGSAESPDIQLRRLSLALIAGYTQLLVDIADGKPGQELSSRIDEMSATAALLASLVNGPVVSDAAVAVVSGLAARFRNIGASSDAAESVLAARGDIVALIDWMIGDSATLYQLFVVPAETRLGNLLLDRGAARFESPAAVAAVDTQIAAESDRIVVFEASMTTYVRLLQHAKIGIHRLADAVERPEATTDERLASLLRQAAEVRIEAERLLALLRELRA